MGHAPPPGAPVRTTAVPRTLISARRRGATAGTSGPSRVAVSRRGRWTRAASLARRPCHPPRAPGGRKKPPCGRRASTLPCLHLVGCPSRMRAGASGRDGPPGPPPEASAVGWVAGPLGQAILLELALERLAVDAEDPCRLGAVPLRVLERAEDARAAGCRSRRERGCRPGPARIGLPKSVAAYRGSEGPRRRFNRARAATRAR
jgi:hypothetical protein